MGNIQNPVGAGIWRRGHPVGAVVSEDLSYCQRREGAKGIPLLVLLVFSYLMSAPLTDQTQPESGVREANHAGQRRVENGMRQERGVVTDNNPYTSKDFRAFCAQPCPPQCLSVVGLKMYSRAVIKIKQEKRENPWNTGICVLFVIAFHLLCQSLFS